MAGDRLMAKFDWSSQKDIDKEIKATKENEKARSKFASKEFHTLNTPAKWELLEILARDAGLIK